MRLDAYGQHSTNLVENGCKLRFTPYNAEQPLQGTELRIEEDKHIGKLIKSENELRNKR